MSDWFFDGGFIPIGIIVCGLLIWLMVSSENAAIADFQRRCVAAGETAAKCQILSEIKRSADNAQMAAGFAAGAAMSRRP